MTQQPKNYVVLIHCLGGAGHTDGVTAIRIADSDAAEEILEFFSSPFSRGVRVLKLYDPEELEE